MTRLAAVRAEATASAPNPPTAAELAARIQLPVRLPARYDGQPIRHLSNSSYTKFILCPEDWRRHYLLGHRTPPSGAMFLGGRVDDALSTYYTQILDHGRRLTLDQVKDAYRDHWHSELATEPSKLGVDWDEALDHTAAFELGLAALELTLAELVPKLGHPTAVQRKLDFALAPGLEWTIQCYLDLETLRRDEHGAEIPTIVDYKVKGSLIGQPTADRDPQASLYLAGRWLEGRPHTSSASRRSPSPANSESRSPPAS